jgi:hypothetical protein
VDNSWGKEHSKVYYLQKSSHPSHWLAGKFYGST